MLRTVVANWSLFLGIGLFALGHGLQGTLLGVRASVEEFPTAITGVIMSAFSIGFMIGSAVAPKLIKNVGHVRVFAAMASIASAAVLAHAAIPEPITWIAMRAISGIAVSSIYIVIESWLNASSGNSERGQLLSIYMVVFSGGMAAGQFLLNATDPAGFGGFVLVSILISIALVPLLLAASPAPPFELSRSFRLTELYRASPLGFFAMFGTGVAHGTFFSLSAVYASELGLGLGETSIFMAVLFAGGFMMQWPVGKISDFVDRRTVIAVTATTASALAFLATMIDASQIYLLMAVFFLFSGANTPLYSLSIAHTNDYLDNDDMVAASGALIMICGVGMALGPTLAALAMSYEGPGGFPAFLGVVHGSIALFALYRMTRRAPTAVDELTPYPIITSRGGFVANMLAQEETLGRIESEDGEDEEKEKGEGGATPA